MSTTVNSKFEGADAMELISLDEMRNGSDNVRGGLRTDNAGRFDLAFLGREISTQGFYVTLGLAREDSAW